MLKMVGQAYSSEKSDFDTIVKALEREGFAIAYQTENSGAILKEVSNLESDNPDA